MKTMEDITFNSSTYIDVHIYKNVIKLKKYQIEIKENFNTEQIQYLKWLEIFYIYIMIP